MALGWDFGEKRPIVCTTEKNTKIAIPILAGTGTPRIGLGRDLPIFQMGESQKRYGVHSNLGTNTSLYWRVFDLAGIRTLKTQPHSLNLNT